MTKLRASYMHPSHYDQNISNNGDYPSPLHIRYIMVLSTGVCRALEQSSGAEPPAEFRGRAPKQSSGQSPQAEFRDRAPK